MPLIDADDAGAAARDVVENLFRHLKADAEPLQPRRHRAAQIVQTPSVDARSRVQSRLGLRPAIEGAAETRENQIAE